LGYLALARVAYEATNYDGALYYYNKIPELSSRRSTALFESSWTYFLKNDYKRAMGSFHSLDSPYYGQWYYPDTHILEATVYLNLCKFGNAKESLASFKDKYLDKQPLLQEYLKTTLKPEDFYNSLVSVYETRGTGEDVGLAMVFVQAVLNNVDFFNSYRVINNLQDEQKALQENLEGLGAFGETVLKTVEEAKRNQLLEAGIKIQQVLTSVDRELTDWSIKADEIDFEIDSARVEEAKIKLQNPDYVPPKAVEGTTLFVVADDWQFWPFEGEYWIDEVANYRSFLRTECIEK
jgi:tetratricopeptide (TPR) repeat protein